MRTGPRGGNRATGPRAAKRRQRFPVASIKILRRKGFVSGTKIGAALRFYVASVLRIEISLFARDRAVSMGKNYDERLNVRIVTESHET